MIWAGALIAAAALYLGWRFTGGGPKISSQEVRQIVEQGDQDDVTILDIRDKASYKQGHIPGSRHASGPALERFIQKAPRDDTVVVVCYHGLTSRGVVKRLSKAGFEDVYSMAGGMAAWDRG